MKFRSLSDELINSIYPDKNIDFEFCITLIFLNLRGIMEIKNLKLVREKSCYYIKKFDVSELNYLFGFDTQDLISIMLNKECEISNEQLSSDHQKYLYIKNINYNFGPRTAKYSKYDLKQELILSSTLMMTNNFVLTLEHMFESVTEEYRKRLIYHMDLLE